MSILSKPVVTDKIVLNNRLVLPPLETTKANEDGSVNEELIDHYDKMSKGGCFSLIIVEHSFISHQGRASEGQLSAAEDPNIPGLRMLTEAIHLNGSKVIMQLNHCGSMGNPVITKSEVIGPSSIVNPRSKAQMMPREMTREDISRIIEEFSRAAKRAKLSGFDGVEIHSAHGYLLNQFYSPITNKRTDEYGGNTSNRIKIHLEVISAVREAVGEEYPILLRLGASDYRDGGTTVEDSILAAAEFEKAGISIIDISGGLCGYTLPNNSEQGYFKELGKAVRKRVSIPVILTGGITDPYSAEDIVEQGYSDLVGVGRAALKDPLWACKALELLRGSRK